jgi:hypothetical protein
MDSLHDVMRAIRPETKSGKDHLSVFREFLAHLDHLQRKAPAAKPPAKPAVRRMPARRAKV